jgi:hypothetical protein
MKTCGYFLSAEIAHNALRTSFKLASAVHRLQRVTTTYFFKARAAFSATAHATRAVDGRILHFLPLQRGVELPPSHLKELV